ncbi:TnsD family Tn7-like transposition protein [Paraburkholderia humisilvae]
MFYEDELLRSAIGRHHRHTLSRSWGMTTQGLYGRHVNVVPMDFPNRMDLFVDNVGHLITETADDLVWKRTLLPFHAAFVGTERQSQLVDEMRSDYPMRGSLFRKIGLGAQRVPLPVYMRTCRACLERDTRIEGEAYWRRAHQLQGVHFCTIHNLPLVETDIEVRPIGGGRQPSRCAELDMPTRDYVVGFSDRDEELLWKISERGVRLLEERRSFTLEEQRSTYREGLRRNGFMRNSDMVDNRNLSREFKNFYGSRVLQFLKCEVDETSSYSWIRKVIRAQEGCHTPIRHLLVEIFLESCGANGTRRPVMPAGPWRCQNPTAEHYWEPTITKYSLGKTRRNARPAGRFLCSCGYEFTARLGELDSTGQPVKLYVTKHGHVFSEKVKALAGDGVPRSRIASQLGVGLATVRKMLGGETRRRSHNGSSESALKMRSRKPELTSTKVLQEERQSASINWAYYDVQLCEQVRNAAAKLASIQPPQRVTKASIMKFVGSRSFAIQLRDGKLPLTADVVSQSVETVESIQCRRVRWLYENWPTGIPRTPWRLAHRAGVHAHRSRDATAKLIDELFSGSCPKLAD